MISVFHAWSKKTCFYISGKSKKSKKLTGPCLFKQEGRRSSFLTKRSRPLVSILRLCVDLEKNLTYLSSPALLVKFISAVYLLKVWPVGFKLSCGNWFSPFCMVISHCHNCNIWYSLCICNDFTDIHHHWYIWLTWLHHFKAHLVKMSSQAAL